MITATYRKLLSNAKKRKLYHDDVILSIQKAANTQPYSDYIRHIVVVPALIIHYFSDVQLDWFRLYLKNEYSCISIDATGGIVKSIQPPKGMYCICILFGS